MKPFTFYDIYYAPIKEMDDRQAGKFFRMICDFLAGKQVTIDAESDAEISPEFELYWESILSDLETYRKSAGKSCGLDKRYKHFPFLPFYRKAFTYLSKHRTAEKLADLLRCIFDVAADDYKIPSPMAKVVLPRYQTKKGSALTYEEEAKLVRYCRENADNAATDAILALLYFGMRQSELATMRVIDGKWLEIETSKERLGQDVVLRRTPFTPMVRKILPLIDFEKARTTNTRTIASTIKRVLPARHVHELRHTYVSRCKECGVAGEVVSIWVGAFPDGYDHFHRLHALFRGVSTKGSGKSKLRLVAYGRRFLLPFYSPISPQSPVFSQNRAMGQCIKIKLCTILCCLFTKSCIK